MIYCPVFENAHFSMIVIDVSLSRIFYFDSLGHTSHDVETVFLRFTKIHFPTKVFTAVETSSPRQENMSDCCFFSCMVVAAYAKGTRVLDNFVFDWGSGPGMGNYYRLYVGMTILHFQDSKQNLGTFIHTFVHSSVSKDTAFSSSEHGSPKRVRFTSPLPEAHEVVYVESSINKTMYCLLEGDRVTVKGAVYHVCTRDNITSEQQIRLQKAVGIKCLRVKIEELTDFQKYEVQG